MKLFVLSDVHSFYEPMMAALEKNGFDINNPDHHIVICGDLFDRGPAAVDVFNFAKEMIAKNRFTYIKGNHEVLLFECINEISRCSWVSSHHNHNGTFDTIVQFTGLNKYDLYGGTYNKDIFKEKTNEICDFITTNAVNYAEFGNYIFVHGWIPCDPFRGTYADNWRNELANWDGALWVNGMEAWHNGVRIPEKTIVCGHYHSSWGHSRLHQDRKEFPQKNRVNWQKSFEPFVDEGIIALDSCVAYTEFCNCVVLEV